MGEALVFLDELANLVAVANRHENIGKHEVGRKVRNASNGGFAVADGHDIDAALFESQRDHFLNIGIIVGD